MSVQQANGKFRATCDYCDQRADWETFPSEKEAIQHARHRRGFWEFERGNAKPFLCRRCQEGIDVMKLWVEEWNVTNNKTLNTAEAIARNYRKYCRYLDEPYLCGRAFARALPFHGIMTAVPDSCHGAIEWSPNMGHINVEIIISKWLEDCCVLDKDGQETELLLRRSYTRFCKYLQQNHIDLDRFYSALNERGITRKKNGFVGIKLQEGEPL